MTTSRVESDRGPGSEVAESLGADGLPAGSVSPRCPSCGSTEQESAAPYNDHSMTRCCGCTLLYTTSRSISTEQYDDVYADDTIYRHMLDMAERTARGEAGRADLWWFKRLALRWLGAPREGDELIDVGCGPGTFLLVARQLGWGVRGIEMAAPAVETARRFGLEVHHGPIGEVREEWARSARAVSCFEVLEHVMDPVAVLGDMREVLRPGGDLVLSVPNLDDPYCLRQSFPAAMPPVHVNFFRRRSLRTALERAGFERVRFFTLPVPTSSAQGVLGRRRMLLRLPWHALGRLFRRADGTTLVARARRSVGA